MFVSGHLSDCQALFWSLSLKYRQTLRRTFVLTQSSHTSTLTQPQHLGVSHWDIHTEIHWGPLFEVVIALLQNQPCLIRINLPDYNADLFLLPGRFVFLFLFNWIVHLHLCVCWQKRNIEWGNKRGKRLRDWIWPWFMPHAICQWAAHIQTFAHTQAHLHRDF